MRWNLGASACSERLVARSNSPDLRYYDLGILVRGRGGGSEWPSDCGGVAYLCLLGRTSATVAMCLGLSFLCDCAYQLDAVQLFASTQDVFLYHPVGPCGCAPRHEADTRLGLNGVTEVFHGRHEDYERG